MALFSAVPVFSRTAVIPGANICVYSRYQGLTIKGLIQNAWIGPNVELAEWRRTSQILFWISWCGPRHHFSLFTVFSVADELLRASSWWHNRIPVRSLIPLIPDWSYYDMFTWNHLVIHVPVYLIPLPDIPWITWQYVNQSYYNEAWSSIRKTIFMLPDSFTFSLCVSLSPSFPRPTQSADYRRSL